MQTQIQYIHFSHTGIFYIFFFHLAINMWLWEGTILRSCIFFICFFVLSCVNMNTILHILCISDVQLTGLLLLLLFNIVSVLYFWAVKGLVQWAVWGVLKPVSIQLHSAQLESSFTDAVSISAELPCRAPAVYILLTVGWYKWIEQVYTFASTSFWQCVCTQHET